MEYCEKLGSWDRSFDNSRNHPILDDLPDYIRRLNCHTYGPERPGLGGDGADEEDSRDAAREGTWVIIGGDSS